MSRRLRKAIEAESPWKLEIGVVTAVDARGSRYVAVRTNGGRVYSRVRVSDDEFQIGDEVMVARLDSSALPIIISKIASAHGGIAPLGGTGGELSPPDNLIASGHPMAVHCRWDDYPGEVFCYQVQEAPDDGTGSPDTSAAEKKLITRGSYYIHLCTADATNEPETWHFRVRAVVWLGDNNLSFSGWSDWVYAESLTWDARYYREDELSSSESGLGASLVYIEDAGGYYDDDPPTVEAALQQIYRDGLGGDLIALIIALGG